MPTVKKLVSNALTDLTQPERAALSSAAGLPFNTLNECRYTQAFYARTLSAPTGTTGQVTDYGVNANDLFQTNGLNDTDMYVTDGSGAIIHLDRWRHGYDAVVVGSRN